MAQSQIRIPSIEELKLAQASRAPGFDPSKLTQQYATGMTLEDTIAQKSLDRQKAEEDLKKEIAVAKALAQKGQLVSQFGANPTLPLAQKAFPDKAAESLFDIEKEKTKPTQTSKNTIQVTDRATGSIRNVTADEGGEFKLRPGEETLQMATTQERLKGLIEQRGTQFEEKQWNSLGKNLNALDKGSRTSVGMAAVGNQRAARALAILNDPNMDPVNLKYATADLAGIMQGGAPHEQMLRQQGYSNLATEYANLMQKITSEPQALNMPEIREHLKNTVTEIMNVDNQILDANVGMNKESYLKAIEKDPKRFERMVGHLAEVKTIGRKPGIQGSAESTGNPGSWDASKESRYQELMRKKQLGTLQ